MLLIASPIGSRRERWGTSAKKLQAQKKTPTFIVEVTLDRAVNAADTAFTPGLNKVTSDRIEYLHLRPVDNHRRS